MVSSLELVDLDEEKQIEQDEFDSNLIDLDAEKEAEKSKEYSFGEKIADLFTQAGRGALQVFSWPLDVIKLGMIGEGIGSADELEELYFQAGKANEFDKNQYLKNVLETSEFIPSQESLEKGFEETTGISLQPKTPLGKSLKQGAGVFAFTPGSFLKRATSAATATVTTKLLENLGVGDKKAELIGDVASLSTQILKKIPRVLGQEAKALEKTASKHLLPFLEVMTKEKAPSVQGKITESTSKNLKKNFNISTQEAINKIERNELMLKRMQERGVNLEDLAKHAYDQTEILAKNNPRPLNTSTMVANIDAEINRIKKLAPSPSEAQKAAIDLLEKQRDVMKVSSPTSEQLIQQHKNYNADMKSIYKKPEFSGKEEEVRKTYEFLKDQTVDLMKNQGNLATANSFKAANKIYHEKSKLDETQRILQKAFSKGEYSPTKLEKLLIGRDGKFLKRNLSPSAIKDIEDIAKYGVEAEKKISKFIDITDQPVMDAISSWGKLAPLLFMPSKTKGTALIMAKALAERTQGHLLTRPATREIYKTTLKNASEGAFQLLKKDFLLLEQAISEEFGDVDTFIDKMTEDLEFMDLD